MAFLIEILVLMELMLMPWWWNPFPVAEPVPVVEQIKCQKDWICLDEPTPVIAEPTPVCRPGQRSGNSPWWCE